MKKLVVFVLLAANLWLTGCTLTETAAQRRRRLCQQCNLQMRMAVEDWDYIWLQEHSAQTTTWHPWIGI